MTTVEIVTVVVTSASLLHTILPPWEAFNDFPTAQKYYKLLIYIIGYTALNGRSSLYQGLSTKNGSQTSQVSNTTTSTPPPGNTP